MHLVRERVTARVSTELEDSLWKHLCSQFQPLVTDVALGFRRTLGLEIKPNRSGGEMFLAPGGEVLYYLVGGDRKSLEVGAVSGPESSIFLDFRAAIEEILGSKKWAPMPSISDRFRMLAEDAEPFRASPSDLEAAEVLANRGLRLLLNEVRKRPGQLLSAFPGKRQAGQLEAHANELDRMGLVTRIFEVFDRETGNKLLRTESYEALEEASSRGFKNFLSGRPIMEERVEQLLTLTERGRRLSQANIWLAFLVARELQRCGISEQDILWISERDAHILDLFVAYQGALLFFEVQEDSVAPDQAFRFLTRARYFQPDAAFLVCPQQLNRDAVQVLLRLNHKEPSVYVVDDLATLEERLKEVMVRSSTANVQRLLARFEQLTVLKVADLVGEHLLGPAPEEPVAEPDEPEVEVEAQIAHHTSVSSTLPDDIDALVGELLEDVDVSVSAGPLGDEGEDELGTSVVVESEEELTSTLDDLTEHFDEGLEVDESILQDEGALDIDALLEEETVLEEATAAEEMTFGEELVPEMMGLPEHERTNEERLEQVLRHILEDLQTQGLTTRVKEVEELLSEVLEVEGCSAALASREGLMVAGKLETVSDAPLVAALQSTLYDAFARATEEGELGWLASLGVEGGQSRLFIQPAIDDLHLLVHESRVHREHEDGASSLPGELVLREAILKKVMEDLGRLEGVQGNLVTSRDGLPIDYQVEEELNLEVLGVVLTQAMVDSEQALERLEMAPARQFLLRTETRWFSVIPLDKEAVMITLLAPDIPRDVWHHKLISAAQMLASVFQ
jgi:predicted regulator of Ras-like GTPase activity (Roadblock/LC7/MglB family)